MPDYGNRKASRIIKQAENAYFYEEFVSKHNGNKVIVKRDYRSKGYQSNYEKVMTYFLIYYSPDNKPIYGTTKTEGAYKKEREKILQAIS